METDYERSPLSVAKDEKPCPALDSAELRKFAEKLYSDGYKSLGIGPDPECGDSPFVKQIIVGHVGRNGTLCKYTSAACSVTLIKTLDCVILVDCSSGYEKDLLVDALAKEEITPANVSHLVITHWHSDHCGNISLFPFARVIAPPDTPVDAYKGGTISRKIGEHVNVEVFAGHTTCDLVVFVEQTSRIISDVEGARLGSHLKENNLNCEQRVIAIVGDLFECEDDVDPKSDFYWKENSFTPVDQAISREFCIQYADIIVPGHGPAFSCSDIRHGLERLRTTFPTTSWEGIKRWKVTELLSFTHEKDTHKIYLIYSAGYRILVNTGAANQLTNLQKALSKVGVSVEEINYLIITSSSLQTCANINQFPNAVVYMADDVALPPFYYHSNGNFVTIEDRIIIVRNFTFDGCGQYSVVVLGMDNHSKNVNLLLICDAFNSSQIRRYNLLFNAYFRGTMMRELKEEDFTIIRTKTENLSSQPKS